MPDTPFDLELQHDTYHQGDSYPPFEATITDATGAAVDLTDAIRGRLHLTSRRTTALDVSLDVADDGTVTYEWSSDDLDLSAGVYAVTVRITRGDGTFTAPTHETASLTIRNTP